MSSSVSLSTIRKKLKYKYLSAFNIDESGTILKYNLFNQHPIDFRSVDNVYPMSVKLRTYIGAADRA